MMLKKDINDIKKEALEVEYIVSVRSKDDEKLLKALRHVKEEIRSINGKDPEKSRSEALRNVGLTLLSLPIDPTQITTATGATLLILSKIVGNAERRSYGLRYVIVTYSKLLMMLKDVFI